MSDDYLWDRTGEPDPDVARLEKALGPLRHEGEWREPPQVSAGQGASQASRSAGPRPARRRSAFIAGGALALAAGIALALRALGPAPSADGPHAATGPSYSAPLPAPVASQVAPVDLCSTAAEGFPFEASGSVTCGGAQVRTGRLPEGVWLETGEASGAAVSVADIGRVQLRAGSKLRIVATSASEHRLELVRGSLHAKVTAPPRLFVIDTRAATAVDLGCEYDLRVDEQGRSHLRVTSGAVSLEGKGRAAYVPAGAGVTADPDRGPGVVIADGATPALVDAAGRLDAGEIGALGEVLARAERRDSVTLWNLLAGAPREAREKIVRRMEELSLRPAKVKREALLAGQAEALEALRASLEDAWFAAPPRPSPGRRGEPKRQGSPPRITW